MEFTVSQLERAVDSLAVIGPAGKMWAIGALAYAKMIF